MDETFRSPLAPVYPPNTGEERAALSGWLDYHRAELLSKLDGLTDKQAAQRVLPSLNTLHGLVRHLSKVEFVWFAEIIEGTGEERPFGGAEAKDGDFRLDDGATLAEDVARFVAACERSRRILAGVSLEDRLMHRRIGEIDVRWIMIHMIEEYAQHNGHADVIRELIDGRTQS